MPPYTKTRPARRKVLIHEARGLGRSTAPRGTQTTSLLARDALAVADAAWGSETAFNLFGVSLGGLVAQELMSLVVKAGS